jgi:hypothetical protein
MNIVQQVGIKICVYNMIACEMCNIKFSPVFCLQMLVIIIFHQSMRLHFTNGQHFQIFKIVVLITQNTVRAFTGTVELQEKAGY